MKADSQPKRKSFLLLKLVAGVVFLTGALMLWNWVETSKTVTVRHPQAITNAGDMPTTEKPAPSEFDSYNVAAELPRYLFIPKIQVKAMVKPMGVTVSNQIEAPKSAYDVGWYDKSAKPGGTGAMVIDGHVSAGITPGVFYDLAQLAVGDEVTVERGDGVKVTYRVVVTKTYDVNAVDMSAVLSAITPHKPALNLITCTGNVIRGTNDYDKRLVVFTEQL